MSRVEELAHPCFVNVSTLYPVGYMMRRGLYHHGLWLLKHTTGATSEPSQRAQSFTAGHFDCRQLTVIN